MAVNPLTKHRLVYVTCLVMFMAVMPERTVAEPDDTPQSKPRFTLVQGKGWTVCERYVKALNALPANGPQPYCHQLQAPQFSDLKAPQWEILNILDHLDTVYEIERKLFAADTNPKFPATKEVWQANLERRLASHTEAPRLRRTRLALDPAGPVETILNYQPDTTQCEREVVQGTYDGSRTGWTYIYDENTRRVDFAALVTWDAELLLFQGRPLFFKTVLGDIPAYGHIYVIHIQMYRDPIHPRAHYGAGEFYQRCHIHFPFPQEFRAGRDIVLPKEQ